MGGMQDTQLQPVPMLDFRREYNTIREEVLAAIAEVCDAQRFILGPEVARFEAAAAEACGVRHAVGCASGTDALWLAMAALEIGSSDSKQGKSKQGGESDCVITTPFSFFATVSSILRAGARPVLADIDERTFNISPAAALEAARTWSAPKKHRLAIMPVHLYGQCAAMDSIQSTANECEAFVIEDAAQAFGATWNGRKAGSLGDIAAFSFYPTKNLAAFGDAGMVTTNDAALAERSTMLRAHGMRRRYFHDEVGWNSRLDTLQAAVLEVRLRHVDAGNARRRDLAALYDELFHAAGLSGETTADGIVLPWTDPRAVHVFHQYVLCVPRRDELRAHLTALGIGTEVYYPQPLHLQHSLQQLGYKLGDFPVAERAAAEVLALPMYPGLRDDEVETVVEAIRRFYA
jgi:dTDP-4-amino-4,6-dideoxygalactose transaminase